ncbi:hypothetical protein PV327_003822 [Microctonus hyperodae]|uniref:HAUS augmin-like complex subunit 3 N-terminal domain-containing protein n=1 Tax=Microctonus hyperodae TaxID=165561 RepID=A0AA39G5R7_MICHY|nr:hypothetical protein PV327_003822 [Microctonus hyperodae]
MSITGKDLADKIKKLMPEQKLKITPEILNETCQHPSVQPFLKWFIENVGPDNILSNEEIQIRKNLQESGAWLKGDELDAALNEAVKDCPELLQLVESNSNSEVEIIKAYESEREGYDADLKDLNTLEDSLKTLQEFEIKINEDIELEESSLEKLRIAENKLYHDCVYLIEEFDSAQRELHEKLQHLLQVYTEAAENRGSIIAWTQVPLELFTKQIETYYNYLMFYIKNEHETLNQGTCSDSMQSLMTNDSTSDNDNVQDLMKCQMNLMTSKLCEIEAKAWWLSYKALADKAKEIYNNGDLQIPQTETQINVEKAELTSKRDILEENNRLLMDRLKESVEHYCNTLITKILVENGEARLHRKQSRQVKLEHLLHLTQDMGHAHSDLLTILMQMQLQKLNEIISFVNDARNFSNTDYELASKRTTVMQEVQKKYESIISSSYCNHNVYNKLFTSMVLGTENSSDAFELANKKYNEIINENNQLRNEILSVDMDNRIAKLKLMEKELMTAYNHETNSGLTKSFKIMSEKITTEFENASKNVENAQARVNETRKKLRNFMLKTAQRSLDREKTILWQRFLADPEGLKDIYDEAQRIIDRSYFVNSLDNQ